MCVPEEWPSRRGSDPPAIQNPAYRPTGTSKYEKGRERSRPFRISEVFRRREAAGACQATTVSVSMLPRVA